MKDSVIQTELVMCRGITFSIDYGLEGIDEEGRGRPKLDDSVLVAIAMEGLKIDKYKSFRAAARAVIAIATKTCGDKRLLACGEERLLDRLQRKISIAWKQYLNSLEHSK